MNTTAQKHTDTYSFTTCRRCGYIVGSEVEICEDCENQRQTNPPLFK